MHDTQQLQKVLDKEPAYQEFDFKQVLGADQLPSLKKLQQYKKWIVILNTDPISRPGQHWVLAMKPHNKNCFFFDSYGHSPAYYQPHLWSSLQGIEKVPTFKLQAPGIYFLYGITMSGKTTALKKIIQYLPQILEFRVPSSEKESNEWVLVPEIKKIDYFYGGTAWQKNPFDFLESMGVQFHSNGLPTQEYLDQVEKDEKPRLIILDDLMQEIHGSKFMVEVFTKAVHHSRLCVFMTQQTLHPHSKHSITLRSQATGSFYFRFSSEEWSGPDKLIKP